MKSRAVLFVFALLLVAASCTTGDSNAPSDDELAGLDQWATTADGKADLPSTWNKLVAWLRDYYTNDMSAVWDEQEHPATPTAALDRIRALVGNAGVTDITRVRFPATVQKLVGEEVDHSEIDIRLPDNQVIRLVGDPKGAGAFVDYELFATSVGPHLCLTWDELQTAVKTSYLPGLYGANFVCHTVTERVLRSLGVGTGVYSSQYRTYAAARWIWGPIAPSFNSQNPASWAVSRSCN